MIKKNNKYIVNILLIAFFGGGAIYFSIKDDFYSSINALLNADPMWLIIAVCLMIIYYCFDGTIFYLFGKLYNKNYQFKQALKNSLSGYFWCGITPFSSGGQFAQVYIFNKQGITPVHSASILLMSFIVYQSILVLFTAFVLIFKMGKYQDIYSGFLSLAMIGFLINASVIGILLLGAKSTKFQKFFCNKVIYIASKIKLVKNFEEAKLKAETKINDFRIELDLLSANKDILFKTAILNFMKLTIVYSIPFFTAKALHLDVSFIYIIDFISICSVVYLITAFVPIPGASGGSEGVYGLMFSYILGGITATSMLLWRFLTYYMGLIIGGIIFAIDKEINRGG